MADPREYLAGSSSLVLGCDSYTSPAQLGDQEYLMGQNVVCRGGIVQTRPGTRSLFCAPDGNFQGCTLFTPDNGVPQLVFAVDGKIYVSAAPFESYRRLWNLQFSPTAKYIAWAVCLKSTDYDNEGVIYSLDNPYSVLVMQDGLTRAAYWDGGNSAHLNPATPPFPDQTDVVPGYTETPIGLWMIWAGNRLWVSRGNQVFASDIGNPLKFTESLYLNEGRAFYLSGPCTGFIATPDQQGIIAFTENDGTFFQSSIQEREEWLATPDFQKVILPNIGCAAPRSLITQYGLNWWFSPRGLTNFNAALRQNLTSRIDYQDNEMMSSKAYLSPDLSGVCGSFCENYLMMSVPSGDVLNRHTWVLDQAPFEGNVNSWTGFWSGWRPVEWARGIVNGDERIFFGSVDYDGKNRIWEAMLEEKTDNGCPITCYAQLRDHSAGNLDSKRYEWTKFFLSQIYGDVHLNVYMASTKGGYQLQKGYKIVASKGQVFMDTEYSEGGPFLIGNRVQSRIIKTPADPDDNECNNCGVESKEGNKIDYAFSHLLVWSGQMGVRAYQMFMRESPERMDGECEEDEVGPRTLNAQGCSGLDDLVDTEVFEQFTGTAEGTVTLTNGATAYIQNTSLSAVSQADADSRAQCAVQEIINRLTGTSLDPGVYGGNADVTDVTVSGGGSFGGSGLGTGAANIGQPGTYIIVEGAPPSRTVSVEVAEYESAAGDVQYEGYIDTRYWRRGPSSVGFRNGGSNTIPNWSAGATYSQNDRCFYSGKFYRSLQNANTNQQPDTQAAYWSECEVASHWLNQALGGHKQACFILGNTTCTTPAVSTNRNFDGDWSGGSSVDHGTGVETWNGVLTQYTNANSVDCARNGSGADTTNQTDVLNGFTTFVGSIAAVFSETVATYPQEGCAAGGGTSTNYTGEATRTLSAAEDASGDLTPGGSSQSSTAGVWSDAWTVTGMRISTATIRAINLSPGEQYRITVQHAATSGDVPANAVIDFTATSGTKEIAYEIPFGFAGAEISIASVSIELL